MAEGLPPVRGLKVRPRLAEARLFGAGPRPTEKQPRRQRLIMKGSMGFLAASVLLSQSACSAAERATAPPLITSLAHSSYAAAGRGLADVSAHPDPLSLLEDANPAFAANKRLVFDMWRGIVNAGHVELADEMLQEGYVQHSPVLPTGRAAFKRIFSAVPRTEIPPVVSPPLVALVAEGNLVVMALREEWPQPNGEGRYATTHFNLFRIEDGRLAEHWHSVQQAPSANVLPPEQGGPQRVTGTVGSARLALLEAANLVLAANKRLVFDAWQTRESGGHLADGFVDHDPTAPTGGPAYPARDVPLVALLAQGDLVVLVTALEHPHPVRAGEPYTTTWFDMFRIKGNRLAEHWNGVVKPGTPLPKYGA
jgi:predicted SnoaL-like aldol condensation-catalyzing enzyme